jgi:hypothetical protein
MTVADTSRHSEGQSDPNPAPPSIPAPPSAPGEKNAARDGQVAAGGAAVPPGTAAGRATSGPLDSVAAWGQADARMARSGFALRRLRYFHDLLAGGFMASRSGDLPSGTLRSERVALAIDRPELDAVALWATRRDDGMVAIPFVEYLLGQFIVSLEMFLADLADPGAAAEVATLSTALEMALAEANRRGQQALVLPQLGDSFLPEPFLERLCGREGLLERTVRRCESLLGEAH